MRTREPSARRRGARALAPLCVALLMPSAALAQDVTPQAPPAPAQADDASSHFARGNELFSRRAYAEAAREFHLAYETSQRAELLFNWGRALEENAQLRPALDAYRRFDQAMPADYDRTLVRERIAAVERRLAQQATARAAPATPAPRAPAAPPRATTQERPPSSFLGLEEPPNGALGLMIGGGTALLAGSVLGVLERTSLGGCRVVGDTARCRDQASLDRARDAPNLALAANVSFVVGATAIAAGVVWWFLAPHRRVVVAPGPGSIHLAAQW